MGQLERKRPIERELLLIAADWQSRTLVLAELEEAGRDVMSLPGIRFGLKVAAAGRVQPSLLVIDSHDDPDATPEGIASLLALFQGVPAILIAGAFDYESLQALQPQVLGLLKRPVAIREIKANIEQALSAAGSSGPDRSPRTALNQPGLPAAPAERPSGSFTGSPAG
jgi:DNA-binding NtrC family response regulator